ncbi:hypothetical protein FRC19_007202, partial [Serendipita sp. 401]
IDTPVPTTLEIWCIVLGEKVPFPVTIARNQSVGHLKKAIYNETKTLAFTSPHLLTLYKINLPGDDNLPKIVEDMKLGSLQPLNPTHRLSEVFSAPLGDETVHILVQPPESVGGESPSSRLLRSCSFPTPSFLISLHQLRLILKLACLLPQLPSHIQCHSIWIHYLWKLITIHSITFWIVDGERRSEER